MLLLTGTGDLLKVVTAEALTIDVHASWVDNAAGTITPGRTNTAITTATTTTIVASPASSTQRNIQTLSVRNKDITGGAVTVTHYDGVTTVELFKYTLGAGEQLEFLDGIGFRVINASGEVLQSASAAPPGVVPVGGIVLWSGLIAAIPTTWALCDGTANAPGPDLRDTFVVGARSDSGGVAKTNIEGSLKQTGGVTGHSHSAHANLTHAGLTIGDHTGLTHSLAIADHPDLTHAALSHPAITITHADHAVASRTHTHAAITLTHPDHSVASVTGSIPATTIAHADHSVASVTHTHAAITVTHADLSVASHANITVPSHSHAVVTIVSAKGATGTGATWLSVAGVTSLSGPSMVSIAGASIAAVTYTHADHSLASFTGSGAAITLTHADHSIASVTHTHAAVTLAHADHSVASFTGSGAAITLTHGDHSVASLSHQAIGTHVGTSYGSHAITAPAAHGTAGTVTHSFSEPNDHALSAHDTVLSLPTYFALAYIQRMT